MSDDALQRRNEDLECDNARLRRLLERRGSPAGLRHQVRNTLAMVRDIIRHSAGLSEGVEDFAAHLEGRLHAVFRIQNAISNSLADTIDLAHLIAGELLTQATSEGERLSIAGPGVSLQPAAAGVLALAIHELAVNAVKFGALSSTSGRLAVSWTAADGAEGSSILTLRWVETGVGDVSLSLPRRGFGSEVIERVLGYRFGGEGRLDFAADGLVCTIRMPLTPSVGSLRRDVEMPCDDGSAETYDV